MADSKSAGARLTSLERRLDGIEARSKRIQAQRPEISIEYIAEIFYHARQFSSATSTPLTQTLRGIGLSAREAEEIVRSYGGPPVE
jgi:hypothetical protein